MPAIISNKNRIVAADYFADQISKIPTYVYIADSGVWDNEPTPPSIKDSTKDRIMSFSDVIAIKRIQADDIISVTRRINWKVVKFMMSMLMIWICSMNSIQKHKHSMTSMF